MILAAEIQMKNRAGKVVGRADTTGNQRTAAEAVEPVGRTRFRNRRVAGKTTGEQRKAQKGYMKQECKHQQQTGEEPHNLTNLKLIGSHRFGAYSRSRENRGSAGEDPHSGGSAPGGWWQRAARPAGAPPVGSSTEAAVRDMFRWAHLSPQE